MQNSNICPKCNYKNQAGDMSSCPQCGIVIDKYNKMMETKQKEDENKYSKQDISSVLSKYYNKDIGINYDQIEPDKYNKAIIRNIGVDHFVVEGKNGLLYFIPYRYILNMVEPMPGSTIAVGILQKKFPLIVQIYHLIIYKGAVGVSMPLG